MKRGGECLVIEEKETKNNYQEEMWQRKRERRKRKAIRLEDVLKVKTRKIEKESETVKMRSEKEIKSVNIMRHKNTEDYKVLEVI